MLIYFGTVTPEERKEYNKQYHLKNKEAISLRKKNDRINNPEKYKLIHKRDHEKHYSKKSDTFKKWVKNNRSKYNSYYAKYRTTSHGKLLNNLKYRINSALSGKCKSSNTIDLIGCDVDFLKMWLESQFKPGMTWDNYGPVWHVDHIRPCSSYDFTDWRQQKVCFNYTNLQPLFAKENISKRDKY